MTTLKGNANDLHHEQLCCENDLIINRNLMFNLSCYVQKSFLSAIISMIKLVNRWLKYVLDYLVGFNSADLGSA